MTIHVCDKCGVRFKDQDKTFSVKVSDTTNETSMYFPTSYNFCPKCWDAVSKLLVPADNGQWIPKGT